MTEKTSRFPLSLSSVVNKKARHSATSPSTTTISKGVVTPQTATKNAAGSASQRSHAKQSIVAKGKESPSLNSASIVKRSPSMVSEVVRAAMVSRIAKQGVSDKKVLAAMGIVPRHLFIEPALASQAYIDASLPIGHHQTISQPYIVARMIEIMCANAKGGVLEKVLEIGTGCAYQAAVLAQVVKEVYSVERIKALHELAKNNLRPLRIPNIRLHYGDGMLGLPQAAPFDGIILAAAGMEVPQALLEQLAIGGRLVAPIGERQQTLQLIERTGKYVWNSSVLEECHFVPLRPGTI